MATLAVDSQNAALFHSYLLQLLSSGPNDSQIAPYDGPSDWQTDAILEGLGRVMKQKRFEEEEGDHRKQSHERNHQRIIQPLDLGNGLAMGNGTAVGLDSHPIPFADLV